jgi:5-methylcytosine-specific restriction endonuclease McrA
MRSDKWKLFRQGIIVARGKKCEVCGDKNGGLHLHHLSYKRMGEELPEDVQLLCRACHQLQHPEKKIIKNKGKKKILEAQRRKKFMGRR